jgi:flagellar hook-basal body complex protein FliE
MNTLSKIAELNSASKAPVSSALTDISSTFGELLNGLNESQQNADNLLNQFVMGEDVDLHDVIIGLQENDVNFKVAISIRDKLVEAYQETMRMQV